MTKNPKNFSIDKRLFICFYNVSRARNIDYNDIMEENWFDIVSCVLKLKATV